MRPAMAVESHGECVRPVGGEQTAWASMRRGLVARTYWGGVQTAVVESDSGERLDARSCTALKTGPAQVVGSRVASGGQRWREQQFNPASRAISRWRPHGQRSSAPIRITHQVAGDHTAGNCSGQRWQ